jgi:hypothetical protein
LLAVIKKDPLIMKLSNCLPLLFERTDYKGPWKEDYREYIGNLCFSPARYLLGSCSRLKVRRFPSVEGDKELIPAFSKVRRLDKQESIKWKACRIIAVAIAISPLLLLAIVGFTLLRTSATYRIMKACYRKKHAFKCNETKFKAIIDAPDSHLNDDKFRTSLLNNLNLSIKPVHRPKRTMTCVEALLDPIDHKARISTKIELLPSWEEHLKQKAERAREHERKVHEEGKANKVSRLLQAGRFIIGTNATNAIALGISSLSGRKPLTERIKRWGYACRYGACWALRQVAGSDAKRAARISKP